MLKYSKMTVCASSYLEEPLIPKISYVFLFIFGLFTLNFRFNKNLFIRESRVAVYTVSLIFNEAKNIF